MDMLEIVDDMCVEGSAPTLLQPLICPESGDIQGYEERWNVSAEVVSDASHSMSLNR
jgi:hypothetical protein